MFVRIKTTPNSPKKSVQIVQSIRKGKTVSQKIVRHIGTALDSAELEKLIELAEFIKVKLESESNPTLFNPETIAEMAIKSRKTKEKENELKVNLKNLREESRVVVGIHEVYGSIYRDLGFDKVIKNPKRNASTNKKLFNIVMARIANPQSKRASVIELEKDFGVKISLEGVYKMMDKLDDNAIEKIERYSYDNAKEILKENDPYILSNFAWYLVRCKNNNKDYEKEILTEKEAEKMIDKIEEYLSHNPNLILYGPPGTGKTYWVRKYVEGKKVELRNTDNDFMNSLLELYKKHENRYGYDEYHDRIIKWRDMEDEEFRSFLRELSSLF